MEEGIEILKSRNFPPFAHHLYQALAVQRTSERIGLPTEPPKGGGESTHSNVAKKISA